MTENDYTRLFTYEHDAGRLELFVRIVYWIAIGIVSWIYGLIAMICLFIQWFCILILGMRSKALADVAGGYFEYVTHRMPYIYFMTDKRPAIMPDKVGIYEKTGQEG